MRIEVDVLDYAIGEVLSMECEDGKWRPVAFFIKVPKWDRKKLQDSWQGDIGSNKRVGKLEALTRGYKVQVWGLDRP